MQRTKALQRPISESHFGNKYLFILSVVTKQTDALCEKYVEFFNCSAVRASDL
jgi:hypothetical protein